MPCPYCAAPATTEMARRTTLGYRMVHCRACRRTCNERTGTPVNHLQVPCAGRLVHPGFFAGAPCTTCARPSSPVPLPGHSGLYASPRVGTHRTRMVFKSVTSTPRRGGHGPLPC